MVVAPITLIPPLANIGFSKFPASAPPSDDPAPMIVWISSIKRIKSADLSSIAFKTDFKRSSNSPLYEAPASIAPKSSARILSFFRLSGTSPDTILCAKPSIIAVLPTPGSPIMTGLFFERLFKICIVRRISSSRPITGSSLLFLAHSVKSVVYFSNASLVLLFFISDFIPLFEVFDEFSDGEDSVVCVSSRFTILFTSSVIFS